MYLAYKYVVISVLLIEGNFLAKRLDFPIKEPILLGDLKVEFVAPPTTLQFGGPGGRIDTEEYSFSEGHHPHCYITRLNPFGNISTAEENRLLSRSRSLIDTNEAYKIATNWLNKIEVNVLNLEHDHKVQIRQRSWITDSGSEQLLPIYDLRWGNWTDPNVQVSIDGRNKQLLEIRMQYQRSFSKRPVDLVKEPTALLAISDDIFLKYSPVQRSNLVAQYCGIVDSEATNDLPRLLSQISSLGVSTNK